MTDKVSEVLYTGPNNEIGIVMNTVSGFRNMLSNDNVSPVPISPQYPNELMMPWGYDNRLPYKIAKAIEEDDVLAPNIHFNNLVCYGTGVQYNDPETGTKSNRPDIKRFRLSNNFSMLHMNQVADLKSYWISCAILILSNDGTKIVNIRHQEACDIRFAKASDKGTIPYIYISNWNNPIPGGPIERIDLLDEIDPLGDLEMRMGKMRTPTGDFIYSQERKFAMVMRVPSLRATYYPTPAYTSIFRGEWLSIKQLVQVGKKAKIKNTASVKYIVEIGDRYWEYIFKAENIVDPIKKKERVIEEKNNIRNFITGVENSGKTFITGFYISSDGKEQPMVKITALDPKTEGGDWSADLSETLNMICYTMGIHPSLVGATPGSSKMNNSGSDKRELFTMKQSMETFFRDLLKMPHEVVCHFNGWEIDVETPMITLTVLSDNADAKKMSSNPNNINPKQV